MTPNRGAGWACAWGLTVGLSAFLLPSPAIAASTCLSDYCLRQGDPTGPAGIAFDGLQFLVDIDFGVTKEFGSQVGLPAVVPKFAIGAVFAFDLSEDVRYPLATPYLGVSPLIWKDSRGRAMTSFSTLYGVNVLGFGDVGVATVWMLNGIPSLLQHGDGAPRPTPKAAPTALAPPAGGETAEPVTSNLGSVRALDDVGRRLAQDQSYCAYMLGNWRGWPDKKSWEVQPWWHALTGDPTEVAPNYGSERFNTVVRQKCVSPDPVQVTAMLDFIENVQKYVLVDNPKYFLSNHKTEGMFFLSVSAGTGVRSLVEGLGLDEATSN